MKYFKKHNKMLFNMAELLVLLRVLNKIKKICAKSSNKYDYSINKSYSSDSGSSLCIDSEWYKIRWPTELNYMNELDHVVTNNIKNKDQCNDDIE